jgi:hypothetical protein
LVGEEAVLVGARCMKVVAQMLAQENSETELQEVVPFERLAETVLANNGKQLQVRVRCPTAVAHMDLLSLVQLNLNEEVEVELVVDVVCWVGQTPLEVEGHYEARHKDSMQEMQAHLNALVQVSVW